MMHLDRMVPCLVAVFVLAPTASHATTLTAGELQLSLDAGAMVSEIAVGSSALKVTPAPLVTLYDMAQGQWLSPEPSGGEPTGGLVLRFPSARATATLTIRSEEGALRFVCRLKGDDLPARGMLLRVAFPWDAVGGQWHNDIAGSVPIEAGKRYENAVSLRAWADLPEWRDQPELRMGYSNRNFVTVVTGPAGLCLAVPLDRPCVHRTAYDGAAKRLEIVYDFALAPETRTPNQAEFAFDLYACDPRWGMRSALARYYELYPELFRRVVNEPGQWMAFSRLSEIDNVDEFYFGLQEGASEPAYDDQLGVLSTTYFTHAGMGANLPDYDPEKDPLPPHEVQVQAMEAAFKARTGIDGVYQQVGLHNAQGKLDVRKWIAYGHLIAQFNLDPELPYGDWTLKRALAMLDQAQGSSRAGLDGFYYDGLSTGINYNPKHFRTADAPCLWDPVAKKPLLDNFLSSCEFARAAAEMLRPRGKITMMNGAMGASFYVAPWLDVLGSETGLRLSRSQLNYIRAITWHKPFLTLLKGNYEQQIGRPEIERYMKQCLAYGIVPGFFDWPTSGLGPGSGYWLHPRYYERDRDLFRKYLPLCCTLAKVGWEPVPYARSSNGKVCVERFGPAEGVVWLTLANEDARSQQTTLAVEAKPLRLDPANVQAVDAISDAPIALTPRNGELCAPIELAPDDVRALQLGTPAALARWRVGQALETLERGLRMRELDKDKPPLAVHWRPGGKTYTRQQVDGKPALVFAADRKAAQSAQQWAMLFQPKPAEVVLRVQASAESLAGPAGSIGIGCRLAWVTPSFSYYDQQFFDLPGGTYPAREFEFRIQSPHALRAIQLTPSVGAAVQGTLRLHKISLSDAYRDQYVADPEFRQWYEPMPEALRRPIGEGCQAIRGALIGLREAAGTGDQAAQQASGEVLAQTERLRALILRHDAADGCRRVLRDLETIERHVKAASRGSPGAKSAP